MSWGRVHKVSQLLKFPLGRLRQGGKPAVAEIVWFVRRTAPFGDAIRITRLTVQHRQGLDAVLLVLQEGQQSLQTDPARGPGGVGRACITSMCLCVMPWWALLVQESLLSPPSSAPSSWLGHLGAPARV